MRGNRRGHRVKAAGGEVEEGQHRALGLRVQRQRAPREVVAQSDAHVRTVALDAVQRAIEQREHATAGVGGGIGKLEVATKWALMK